MQTFPQFRFSRPLLLLSLGLAATCAHSADAMSAKELTANKELVSIQNAWVRSTNAGQSVGAAYMTLTSPQDATLVAVESDVTKNVEIHSMSMQSGVMKMRMLDTLPLAAGKPYTLAPGGFHLMLFDLKKPLNVGEPVNFVLHFKKIDSKTKTDITFKQNVKAMVQSSEDGAAAR
ncbi:MAG TPA: copper chaperone PCu(A)C [Methylotenera sp.]|nr:copper chaperone PCu(A)C [Methylotenera sp.]